VPFLTELCSVSVYRSSGVWQMWRALTFTKPWIVSMRKSAFQKWFSICECVTFDVTTYVMVVFA